MKPASQSPNVKAPMSKHRCKSTTSGPDRAGNCKKLGRIIDEANLYFPAHFLARRGYSCAAVQTTLNFEEKYDVQ